MILKLIIPKEIVFIHDNNIIQILFRASDKANRN